MSSIYKRSRTWWYKVYDAALKRYHYRSLATSSYRVALTKKVDLDAEFLHRIARNGDSPSMAQALQAYLEATAARRSPEAQQIERMKAAVLQPSLGAVPVVSLTSAQVDEALTRLMRERAWSPTTYNHYRKTLVSWQRWALARGWLGRDVMAAIPRLKETPYERPFIPYPRWEAFLALGTRSVYGPLAATLLLTGLRPKELLQLEWRDFDWTRRILTVRAEIAKSRRARYIPIPDRLARLLKPLVKPEGICFEGYSQGAMEDAVRRWLVRLGLRGKLLGPYVLRHSYGARLAELLPAFQIQQLMGHQTIVTTQRYVHAHEIQVPDAALRKL